MKNAALDYFLPPPFSPPKNGKKERLKTRLRQARQDHFQPVLVQGIDSLPADMSTTAEWKPVSTRCPGLKVGRHGTPHFWKPLTGA
jgi:hypothetical protein